MGNAKMKFLPLIFFLIVQTAFGQDDHLWKQIEGKTWSTLNIWAGQGVTFYETESGERKAIIQHYGSGMPVLSSEIFPVTLDDNFLQFKSENGTEYENLRMEIISQDTLRTKSNGYTYLHESHENYRVRIWGESKEIMNLDSLKTGRCDFKMGEIKK